QGREISRPFLNLDATQMISFAAHKGTIDLAMQNRINLVALLLCDNDLIKRAVSARVKFYRKRRQCNSKILRFFKIPLFLCRFKILRYEISNLKFMVKFRQKIPP
ncbi:hypothetical protein, partial [uncultured Campylobacter sp.]|uniref:hypothetical protein n=1 Tax=uncultured Campylobacter sp. TaxID=218934 RepID=UPI0026044854